MRWCNSHSNAGGWDAEWKGCSWHMFGVCMAERSGGVPVINLSWISQESSRSCSQIWRCKCSQRCVLASLVGWKSYQGWAGERSWKPPLPAPALRPALIYLVVWWSGLGSWTSWKTVLYLIFPGLFSTWKISQPALLQEHRNACIKHSAELGTPWAAVL